MQNFTLPHRSWRKHSALLLMRAKASPKRVALLLLAATTFAAPGAKHTAPATPPAFHASPSTTTADLANWWKKFNDPELNSLIDRALRANLDLRVAEARIQEARAGVGMAKSQNRPSISLGASDTRGTGATVGQPVPSGKAPAAAVSSDYSVRQFGPDLNWEHDLFGTNRHTIKAAQQDVLAAEEDRRAVLVVVLSDMARYYIQLRGYQDQIAIARESVTAQRDNLSLVESRVSAGLATDVELTLAQAQLSDAEASIPSFEIGVRESCHRIAVLTGEEPGALLSELSVVARVPDAPPDVPPGLPSELLRRRPDVRKAERQLDAASARSAAARAERFPKFSLTGSVGSHNQQVGGIRLGGNWFYGFGPSVSLPILSGGKIRADIQSQSARERQADLNYQESVLVALEDVENSLTGYDREREHSRILQQSASAAQRNLDVATELYRAGVQDFSPVLVAQQSLIVARAALADSRRSLAADLVALYKSLGGGWE